MIKKPKNNRIKPPLKVPSSSNSLPPLISESDIKFNSLKKEASYETMLARMNYDKKSGMLDLRIINTGDDVVHYVSDKVALLYDSKTMECVGFHIEGI